jgi:hypothetical protein
MNRKNSKRITDDTEYKKVGKSYQDNLSPSEIKDKLEDYKPVFDISTVALNSHIRYFTNDEKSGKKLFRLGGFLIKNEKDYIVLSNGNLNWSVQKKTSTFYHKMSIKEIKEELKEEIIEKVSHKYEKKINDLAQENAALKQTLKAVKKTIKKN